MNLKRKTKQLLATASHGRIPIRAFDEIVPSIAKQMRRDADSDWLNAWGQSLNFDEFERATIVDRKILSTIGRITNYSIRDGRCYHAGLMHTYGYLLSNLNTRFGFKRERWTNGKLESSFGLPEGIISANPSEGTLLQNVSYLLSQIAFSRSRRETFAAAAESTPSSLLKLRLPKTRITEEIVLPKSRQRLKIYMDIVRFKRAAPLEAFMVYSTESRSTQQLITCFPISNGNCNELIANAKKNELPIRPRFNLFFAGFPIAGLSGKRNVSKMA